MPGKAELYQSLEECSVLRHVYGGQLSLQADSTSLMPKHQTYLHDSHVNLLVHSPYAASCA